MATLRFLQEWYAVPDNACSRFFFAKIPLLSLAHKNDAMQAFERFMMFNPAYYYIIFYAAERGPFGSMHIDQRRDIVAMRAPHGKDRSYDAWRADMTEIIERVYVFRTLEDLSGSLEGTGALLL